MRCNFKSNELPADEYIGREVAIEFVKKYTPCINGATTMQCVERALRNCGAKMNKGKDAYAKSKED